MAHSRKIWVDRTAGTQHPLGFFNGDEDFLLFGGFGLDPELLGGCAVGLHDPPGDHGEDEQFAAFTHAGDIDEDDFVVMEVPENLRDARAGFPEEFPVALHDVSDPALDDLKGAGVICCEFFGDLRVWPGIPVSFHFVLERTDICFEEERDHLSSRKFFERLDNIPLGRGEVVEQAKVGHPEIIVVEPEAVERVLFPVGLADGKDGEPVHAGTVVDKPERPFPGAGLPAPHVLAMGVDHQEAELLHLHAGGTEGLHEVALAHAGGGKHAHVLGEDPARDFDREILKHALPGPHDTDFDISHDFGEERKVLCFGDLYLGELGRDGAGFPEDAVLVNKPERDCLDTDKHILAKPVEVLAERAGVPAFIGKVALVDKVAHLGIERILLGSIGDLQDIADEQFCRVGDDKAVREHAPANQPEFCCIHIFNIVQSHHVNHQRGLQMSCSCIPCFESPAFMSCCICITSGSSITTVRCASRSG